MMINTITAGQYQQAIHGLIPRYQCVPGLCAGIIIIILIVSDYSDACLKAAR